MSNGTTWQRTSVQGLLRNRKSGVYYGRWKIHGKQKWLSYQTTESTVARELHRRENNKVELQRGNHSAVASGEATMGALFEIFCEQVRTNPDIKEATRTRKLTSAKYVTKTLPEIAVLKPAQVTTEAVAEWSKRIKTDGSRFTPPGAKTESLGNSSSTVNKAIAVLHEVMELALRRGAIGVNPVAAKSEGVRLRKKTWVKPQVLPSDDALGRVLRAMETNGARGGWGIEAADFCRFLAYSGMRVGEAGSATWGDVDFTKRKLYVRGTKTETSRRFIPLFPDLEKLLQKLMERRKSAARFAVNGQPYLNPTDSIFRLKECQKTIDAACKKEGVTRFTHHHLRDLFTTKCIEAGVDIPTVARWLGHSDGGALLMKTYGHLRDEHSQAQAAKVSFGGGL